MVIDHERVCRAYFHIMNMALWQGEPVAPCGQRECCRPRRGMSLARQPRARPARLNICRRVHDLTLRIGKAAPHSYFRFMRSVGIKTLKNKLSEYVRLAAGGERRKREEREIREGIRTFRATDRLPRDDVHGRGR